MTRSKITLLTTVVLALSAGVVVGRVLDRIPVVRQADHRSPSWLDDQLNLNSEQRQQIDAIWADVRLKISKSYEKRHELDNQRTDSVTRLLTADQKVAYDKLIADYRNQRAQVDKDRLALLHDANERSRALLTDSQRQTWDVISKGEHERRGPRGAATQKSTSMSAGIGGPGDHS